MTYSMTTIYNGTKIRQEQSTHNPITKTPTPELARVPAGVVVSGNEKWTALTDGYEVKAGDVWVRVTYNGVTGWMAYIHKGQPICKDLVEVGTPPEDPPVTVEFPQSVVWEYVEPSTNKPVRLQYIFDKIVS